MFEGVLLWLKENQDKVLIFIGIILVGVLSFEAGLIQGRLYQTKPLVLSIPKEDPVSGVGDPAPSVVSQLRVEPVVAKVNTGTNCFLVGSKNSDKYHLSTCAVVKRIKSENKVCFSSKEDAEKKGYKPGCIK